MYRLVEIWSVKPAFAALSSEDRQACIDRALAAVAPSIERGMTLVAAGFADTGIAGASRARYFSIWEAADVALVRDFLGALEVGGWFEWFEQINIAGDDAGLGPVLKHHVTNGT